MLGVTRLILDKDEGSARGDEDFFSVARTMPFVAECVVLAHRKLAAQICLLNQLTFNTKCCYALVYCV